MAITSWVQTLLSVVKWRERQLVSAFYACGLQQRIVQVDTHTSIAFWCGPLETQESKKPALLLIHGFGGSSTWQWEKQVKPLHKRFRLFLPDLVFFGKSSTKSHHRSEIFQAQVIALAMEAMAGVSTYSVVGISYGGFVAFRLAHMFQDKVEKVVIVSAGMCITPRDVQGLLDRAHVDSASDLFLPQSPAILRTLMQLSFLKPFPFLPTFVCNDVIQSLYTENREERKELLDSLQIGRQDREALPILSQKVLIIWGDKDGIFPLELGFRLKEHLKDNAELAVIKNTAHAVQLENPPEFNNLILRFLLEDTPVKETSAE